jgi:hypothetical protein
MTWNNSFLHVECCSEYTKIVLHRLVIEAKGRLYTTPTPFKPRRLFHKGQNRDGLTPKRTISRRCELEVGSEQVWIQIVNRLWILFKTELLQLSFIHLIYITASRGLIYWLFLPLVFPKTYVHYFRYNFTFPLIKR